MRTSCYADPTAHLPVRCRTIYSEAFEKGLRVGDVIVEAGQNPVATILDFEERLEEA